eukprot:TRINITY_DN13548_c0_g1_i1.p1 TRINITY_DN13548_c0_g1~~TRINITY_DN13548_c0_g1_i1.p1  ORF type:complete len:179 (+),score=47.23 TRINITY_DN13548_c0_g1_i1:136-672(+)
MTYSGADMLGQPFIKPPCNAKLRQLFWHCTELIGDTFPVPLPSYKQTPLAHRISQLIGVDVSLKETISLDQIQQLHVPSSDAYQTYFGWQDTRTGKRPQRQIRAEAMPAQPIQNGTAQHAEAAQPRSNLYLQFGWLDGVCVSKGSAVRRAQLVVWETEGLVQAHDHVPLRALLQIHLL